MALHNQDFLLTPEQLDAINTHIQSRYQQAIHSGRFLTFPKAQVIFEFTAVLGRSVCVVFEDDAERLQIESCARQDMG